MLREPCDLPLVKLSERDEQLIFDVAVRIRYGDYKTLAETCLDLESHLLRDFPLECFLQKPDVLKALLDTFSAGASMNHTIVAGEALGAFLREIPRTLAFLKNRENRVCRTAGEEEQEQERSHAQSKEDAGGALRKREEAAVTRSEEGDYVALSYPSSDVARWKYDEERARRAGALSIGDSLSALAAILQIMTVAIDVMKEEERVGYALSLH